MSKRLAYIVIGALSVVFLELLLEGIQYTTPPDWFYPIWMMFGILFGIIALPAHLLTSFIIGLLPVSLQPPFDVKPYLIEQSPLYIAILLTFDALEGAFLGWLFSLRRSRTMPAGE